MYINKGKINSTRSEMYEFFTKYIQNHTEQNKLNIDKNENKNP